jgi:hypothetical protein
MRSIERFQAEKELKELRAKQEQHFIIDFFKRGSGNYSIRKEDIGARSITEATLKALEFLPSVELEDGPVDRITVFNPYNWGDMIVWKKLKHGLIARLLVPARAHRIGTDVNGLYNHIKCQYVKVLNIYDGENEVSEGVSISAPDLKFKKGEFVYPDGYIHDCRREPSPGIYACYTREQAEKYQVNPIPGIPGTPGSMVDVK